MRKLILLMTLLFSTFIFANMKDGIYYVEKNHDKNWNSFARITVKNSKIINAQYDRRNINGGLLSINQAENDKYKATFGETFRDSSFCLTRSLVSQQNVDSVDKVKDPRALDEFKQMIRFLIEKSNEGKTGNFKM